eukprot:6489389-Amphidinium_carterae.1
MSYHQLEELSSKSNAGNKGLVVTQFHEHDTQIKMQLAGMPGEIERSMDYFIFDLRFTAISYDDRWVSCVRERERSKKRQPIPLKPKEQLKVSRASVYTKILGK